MYSFFSIIFYYIDQDLYSYTSTINLDYYYFAVSFESGSMYLPCQLFSSFSK